MVEKKLVIDEVYFTYNGPFDMNEFYRMVDDWKNKNGMDLEIKRKLEHVEKDGKNVEWTVELYEKPADWAKVVVRLKAQFEDVKEVILKKGKLDKRMQVGKVVLIFDGFLETNLGGRWQQKPTFWFLRALFDKYVYKGWSGKFEDVVTRKLYNLFEVSRQFFQNYGY